MLQNVEILPGARRSLRRAVSLEADLVADPWETARSHRVLDLSPEGMRVAAASLLPVGEHVVVCFTPPGWWLLGELNVWARVARAEPRRGARPATLGLSFLDLPVGARDALAHTLRGLPPPLTIEKGAARRELVWVDMLVTWTEDLGDRINTFEVSDVLAALDDAELEPAAMSGLLTGGRPEYRWQHAA
jgi:hypothetical protein